MEFETISVKRLDYYVSNPYAIIVDIRCADDYKRCHIKNAIHIDFEEFDEGMKCLDKNKTIVIYCERGATSLIAAKKLSDQGYFARSVIGGINMYNGKNRIYG